LEQEKETELKMADWWNLEVVEQAPERLVSAGQ
jgi:hypothetical protein